MRWDKGREWCAGGCGQRVTFVADDDTMAWWCEPCWDRIKAALGRKDGR